MRLVGLETVNFKHLGGHSGVLALEFGEGVIGVRGPNESGKSSLMQAVFFALTGQPLEGGREIGHYVRYGAGRASVRLRFEVDGREYVVERLVKRRRDDPERGTTTASLYEVRDGGMVKVVAGVREVNEFISKLLGGLGPEELRSTVFIIQKDLDRLKEKKASERRELIDSLIGRESFDRAKDLLNETRKELEGTPGRKGEIERSREELERLKERLDEFRKLEEELRAVEGRISILEGSKDVQGSVKEQEHVLMRVEEELRILEQHHERRERLKEMIRELENRMDRLTNEIENLREKKRDLEGSIRELEDVRKQIQVLEGPKEVEGSISWLVRRKTKDSGVLELLKELRDLSDRLARRESDLERVRSELDDLLRRMREREDYLRRSEEAVKRLLRKREKLGFKIAEAESEERRSKLIFIGVTLTGALLSAAGAVIPWLGTIGLLLLLLGFALFFTWTSDLSRRVTELKKEREAHERELRTHRGLVDQHRSELESLEVKRRGIEEELIGLEAEVRSLREEIRAKISELRSRSGGEVALGMDELARVGDLLEDWSRRVMKLDNLISQAKERLGNLRKRREELEKRVKLLAEIPSLLKDKERDLEETTREREDLLNRLSHLDLELPGHLRPFKPEMIDKYRNLRKEVYGELERRKEELRNLRERKEGLLLRIKELEGIEERVREAEEKLRELEKRSKIVRKAMEMIDMAAKATRDAVRPAIEYGMSTILPVITEGRYGRVRIDEETFDVEIYDSDAGGYIRLERFSGGTIDQVLLAMRLAFTLSIIPKMKGQHPEFLFMDEVLASSDSERRKRIMELVTTNLRKNFAQIVAISHQEDVLRYADRHVVMMDGEARM